MTPPRAHSLWTTKTVAMLVAAAAVLAVTLFTVRSGAVDGTAATTTRSVTIGAGADTYVSQAHPRQPHGTWTWLATCPSSCDAEKVPATRRALLRFDVGGIPAAASGLVAELRLRSIRAVDGRVSVGPAPKDWDEPSTTWDSQPAQPGTPVATRDSLSGTGYDDWDVSRLVTGNGTVGMEVSQSAGAQAIFASNQDRRGIGPQLVLTFQVPADTPPGRPAPSTASPTGPPAPTGTAPTGSATGQPRPTASTGTTPAPVPTGGGIGPGAADSAHPLPFDLPSTASLRSSSKLVFAHYFTPYPISLDNQPPDADYYARNYLQPGGESGKFLANGGLLRDRPLGRDPLDGDWQLEDMKTEVRRAVAVGIDGFTVDLLDVSPGSTHWARVQTLLTAAEQVDPGFRIVPMPDMTTLGDPNELADAIATLARSPVVQKVDGRVVVAPFDAERQSPSWWSSWIGSMRGRGVDVALVPTFLNFAANAEAFSSISYGFSVWGDRSPAANADAGNDAATAHAMGKVWMAPVSVQDERPNQGIFDEANNTENLRVTWRAAIDGGADWVQIPTWNDYSEGAQVNPSANHGWVYSDISSYYLTRFKTGSWPAVTRDALYLTHRVQFVNTPATVQTALMRLRGGSSPARDTVEVLSFLPAPATITVRVGGRSYSYDAPAGEKASTFPLGLGTVSAAEARGGAKVATVASPFAVRGSTPVQDLDYRAVSSAGR